jgi:hypothetical protein
MEPVRRVQEDRSPEAVEFIRFCYRRRRAGWPEIYDEMCAVAGRGLFHGWTHEDLATHGIGFSLLQMPALAAMVRSVIEEEDTRRRAGGATGATRVAKASDTAASEGEATAPVERKGAPVAAVA